MTDQDKQSRLIIAGNVLAIFAVLLFLAWIVLECIGQRHSYLVFTAIGFLLFGICLGGGSTLKWLLP